ncbi:Urease accessory protein UreD [hydrothermal vent metagenome]|uniref:Urease accessory protein UreD n=1 Tax=hydrothermal vent metagenome TaxID=652676 RepID=A0A3B0Z825_9ZZZZ
MSINSSAGIYSSSWCAELELHFRQRFARTVMVHCRHLGPLRVQKSFYPAEGECHVYLLHPPGGIVGGDQLSISINVEAEARVLITTPGAGKYYRSTGAQAKQQQRLVVGTQALLEWFPQEQIIFDGAQAKSSTRVELDEDAQFIGWDITCFGRPASRDYFLQGRYQTRFELWRGEHALYIERGLFDGGSDIFAAPWGLRGHTVVGTLLCTSKSSDLLGKLSEALYSRYALSFSVSLLDDVMVCRYLGDSTEEAKSIFAQAWQIIRPVLVGRKICRPRIWNT